MGDVDVGHDVFDGDTAVGEVAIPREALPTGAIERFGRAITAVNEAAIPREALPTGAIERMDAAAAVHTGGAVASASPVQTDRAVVAASDTSSTITSATASAPAVHTDKIARQRGLTPIGEPYVRERVRIARGWFYLARAIFIASLVVTASVVMWAREEVRRARAAVVPPAAAPVAPPAAEQPPAIEVAPAPAPAACAPPVTELSLESRPAGATVTLDGRVLGKTPLVTTVNRYEEATLWFRAPGRIAERRKLVPTESAKTVRVSLQRRL